MPKALHDILETLVRIPSVSGDTVHTNAVIEAVEKMLAEASVEHVKTGEINQVPYLVASSRPTDSHTVWFISHLDVVPADKKMFQVTEDADKYYGRGVFDMKGMAAAVLSAFLRVKSLPDINVGLMFTTDEEIGGKNGVGTLAKENEFHGAAAYVLDQGTDFVLMEKMKGVLWLEVAATGTAAHGARPWLGDSANEKLISILHEFGTWFKSAIPQDHPKQYFTTYNIGTINGGEATNQVSDAARATIDVRFVSDSEAQHIEEALQAMAKKLDGVKISVLAREPFVETDTTAKWFQATKKMLADLGEHQVKDGERLGHGSTDGRYFAPHRVPVISTRPPGGDQHGPDEWVSKAGLQKLEELVYRIMALTAQTD